MFALRTRIATHSTKNAISGRLILARGFAKHVDNARAVILDRESTLEVVNPTTGRIEKEIPVDTHASLQSKFQKSKAAQGIWAKVPISEKINMLQRFGTYLDEEKDALATTLTKEMGKPISQAHNEINAVKQRISFFVDHTEEVMKSEVARKTDAFEEIVSYEPLGVVGNISAWNYPYFVGANVFVPALLTGNTVLYKPSEYTPMTGDHIARLLHKSGVPEEVFTVVHGRGQIGEAVAGLPLGGVFFTGSHPTGVKVASKAAPNMARVQLELGGKDPAYVCADADVETAAKSLADGAFYNTGQSCCSVERIYIHRSVYSKFVDVFVAEVKGFSAIHDPLDSKAYIGPLARSVQVDFLKHLTDHALRRGAQIACGTGQRLSEHNGNYFSPTVLTNVNHKMELQHLETFGPLIGLQMVENDEEAIALMNDTTYGLTAGVYTPDRARAERILGQVDSGTSYWNACDRVSPFLPWSGRKFSGVGSTLGKEGIRAFLRPRGWHMVNPSK